MTARKPNTASSTPVISLFLGILSFSMLGCGGGGDSWEKMPVESPSRIVLASFSDQSGIGRQKNTRTTFHVMSGNIQQWQDNIDSSNTGFKFNDSDDSFVKRYSFAVEQRGVRKFAGMDWNASTFTDYDSGVGVSLLYTPSGNTNFPSIILVGGNPAGSLPTGKVNYNGQTVINARGLDRFSMGTFDMSVDFANGTGTISGNASSMSIQLQGSFAVDTGSATFSGDDLALAISSGFGAADTAKTSLYGSFHGEGAVGVSGVYYNNAESPAVFGSIIGASKNSR